MESSRPTPHDSQASPRERLGRLWQVPLLILSLGLFGYAAWLFINPRRPLTGAQKVELAEALLRNNRPDDARTEAAKLIDAGKLPPADEAHAELLLSRCIDASQKRAHDPTVASSEQIILHARAAIGLGAKLDAADFQMLGQAYERAGRIPEALASYAKAIAGGATAPRQIRRRMIELELAGADPAPAEAGLDDYLKDPLVVGADRAWAMGEKSRLLVDRGQFADARTLLGKALKLGADPASRGDIDYRLGYCAYKLGDRAEAERLLRLARNELAASDPLDGDAGWLLGRALQDRGDFAEAASFFQDVLVGHPGARIAPLAQLGRGVCRIETNQDEAGLSDLHDCVPIIARSATPTARADATSALRDAGSVLRARADYRGALELMALESKLTPNPPPDFYARLANLYEKRSAQVQQSSADAVNPEQQESQRQQAIGLLNKAGASAVALSRALTVQDDKGHADALWRGIDLYDRAGNVPGVISALETFINENPSDGQTPDALLRLGQAHQAAGEFDKAVEAFQRIQFRYPQSLAAPRSGVSLAQAYVDKGPAYYAKAEAALLATLASPLITPEAEEFRDALFALAKLYYRTQRYEAAVGRLEELSQRYPNQRTGHLLFLMADSYRKSADLLKSTPSPSPSPAPTSAPSAESAATGEEPSVAPEQLTPGATPAARAAARRERLAKAGRLYARCIDAFFAQPPRTDLERLYLKLAHFYRADAAYEAGDYAGAIRLYDAAALRFPDDPGALEAYVQIVNAYTALGQPDEARAANERARQMLGRMSPLAFKAARFAMPRSYWDEWLRSTGALVGNQPSTATAGR